MPKLNLVVEEVATKSFSCTWLHDFASVESQAIRTPVSGSTSKAPQSGSPGHPSRWDASWVNIPCHCHCFHWLRILNMAIPAMMRIIFITNTLIISYHFITFQPEALSNHAYFINVQVAFSCDHTSAALTQRVDLCLSFGHVTRQGATYSFVASQVGRKRGFCKPTTLTRVHKF